MPSVRNGRASRHFGRASFWTLPVSGDALPLSTGVFSPRMVEGLIEFLTGAPTITSGVAKGAWRRYAPGRRTGITQPFRQLRDNKEEGNTSAVQSGCRKKQLLSWRNVSRRAGTALECRIAENAGQARRPTIIRSIRLKSYKERRRRYGHETIILVLH